MKFCTKCGKELKETEEKECNKCLEKKGNIKRKKNKKILMTLILIVIIGLIGFTVKYALDNELIELNIGKNEEKEEVIENYLEWRISGREEKSIKEMLSGYTINNVNQSKKGKIKTLKFDYENEDGKDVELEIINTGSVTIDDYKVNGISKKNEISKYLDLMYDYNKDVENYKYWKMVECGDKTIKEIFSKYNPEYEKKKNSGEKILIVKYNTKKNREEIKIARNTDDRVYIKEWKRNNTNLIESEINQALKEIGKKDKKKKNKVKKDKKRELTYKEKYYTGYRILPQASERYLYYDDIRYMDLADVQLAINELYAVHGLIFSENKSVRNYFKEEGGGYVGYIKSQEKVKSRMTALERENLEYLAEYRKELR